MVPNKFNEKDVTIAVLCKTCGKSYIVTAQAAIPKCCGADMEEVSELARQFGQPTETQLARINRLTKRPLTKDEVFSFSGKLAGDVVIPNRYVQLSKQLLDVFRNDAIDGVSLLIGHPWAEIAPPKAVIAYGRTYDARLTKGTQEGEAWSLLADHYMLRGLDIDGISTDSLIKQVEAGIIFDTSIGWGASNFTCSVCQRSIRACDHWPGQTYDIDGKQVLCWAIAKPPGYLMENSFVFDGAYPTAGILSAMGSGHTEDRNFIEVQDFKSVPDDVAILSIYSATKGTLNMFVKKSDIPKTKFAAGSVKKEDVTMPMGLENTGNSNLKPPETTPAPPAATETQTQSQTTPAAPATSTQGTAVPPQEGVKLDAEHVSILVSEIKEKLGKDCTADEILSLAKTGISYRNELIEETIKWGVRSLGNEFKADSFRKMLSEPSRTIEDIQAMRDMYQTATNGEIPAGRSTDPTATGGQQQKPSTIPDSCFKTKIGN